MSADDRLRDAFRDLSDRAARDIDPAVPPAPGSPAGDRRGGWVRSRPGLVIAGLAVVVAGGAAVIGLTGGLGDDGDQQVATDTTTSLDDATDRSSTGDDPDADDGGDGDGSSTATTDGSDGTDDPGPDADGAIGRYRVAAATVAADAADPFLNLRAEPDAGSALVAKLPPTYTGLLATGSVEQADDGGTWLEVELLNPVALAGAIDTTTRVPNPRGWVNEAFVEPLADGVAVGTEELAACADGESGAGVEGSLGDGHLQVVESELLTPTCLRVVLTFGRGPAPIGWIDVPDGTAPATAVPTVRTRSSGGYGTAIDLGPITTTWSDATETDDGVYLARTDDGGLDLISPTPADVAAVVARPERGLVVIDLELSGTTPPTGAGVVLTREPSSSAGTIEVIGLARPFEALLGVRVEDDAGQPVEAVFSGNGQTGTRRTDGYGVATTDWVEAWGTFAVRIEGLEAGDYTVVLNAEDVGDDPRLVRLPVTVEEAGTTPVLATDDEQRAALGLLSFARSGNPAAPLADGVTLALGPEPYATATAAELAAPGAWAVGAPDGFAGFSGPFNPLDQLRRTSVRITAGPVPHCAGPPRDWPSEFDGLRQVNIEPIGIDSCIDWYGVHLFLDGDDRIAGVALDLFGP